MNFERRLYEVNRRCILGANDGFFLVVVSGGLVNSGED